MHECIGPRMSAPLSVAHRNRSLPCPKLLPGNALPRDLRRVGWDGYLSYDGVLYGLPSNPPLAGSVVQVRERHGVLSIWSAGQLVVEYTKRPQSQLTVTHPDQFRTVVPAAARRAAVVPLGHLRPAPLITKRDLADYDHLYGVEVLPCNH